MPDDNIRFDPKNYRIHTDKNKRVIEKSLKDCGAGRSVLVDKDNMLIAGNGVYEQAQKLGIPVKFIESDGKELIVVKRTDISNDDEKRKLLALADNYASDTSMFDVDLVLEDFTPEDLDLWEFSLADIEIDTGEENNPLAYSNKIEAPIYEPKNEKPLTSELLDHSKAIQLIEEIQNSSLTDGEKEFLIYSAYRHIVFDYEKIADFYAHSSKECQKLMEKSMLVIIDFNKAMELGYVKLSEEIANQYLEDHGDR